MQTFTTYSDLRESARCLDSKRLNKQLVETKQIYDTIVNNKKAWSNHPVVNLWRGCEAGLLLYGKIHYEEWKERYVLGLRGGKLTHKSGEEMVSEYYNRVTEIIKFPSCIYDDNFLISHRSNLIRKNPEYYSKFWPNTPNNIPYYWPA